MTAAALSLAPQAPLLAKWLAKAGAVGAGADSSSEADGEGRGAGSGSDGEGGGGGRAAAGPLSGKGRHGMFGFGGEPCAECGRCYPHEHVRVLRAGGAHAGRGGDDEDDDE